MNKIPAVSIVIPTYNHAHFLKRCIQSIIDQTYKDWEAIIVNNYSEDNTIEIVESFNDPRIQLINFKNNGIIAASRNEGIRRSNAQYIAFLDSDDFWYPTKLERCLEIFKPNVDLVCHGLRFIKNGKHIRDVFCGPAKRAGYYRLLFNGSCLITSAVSVRKASLIKVGMFSEEPDIVTSEDLDLWLKLAWQGFCFRFADEILGEYYVHENSASNSIIRHMNSKFAVLNKHFSNADGNTSWNRIRRRKTKALIYYGAARNYQQNRQRKNALSFFRKSLSSFPLFLRAYAGIALTIVSRPSA